MARVWMGEIDLRAGDASGRRAAGGAARARAGASRLAPAQPLRPRGAPGHAPAEPMYGKTGVDFPQRVVCLTAETAEIAFRSAPATASSACPAPRAGPRPPASGRGWAASPPSAPTRSWRSSPTSCSPSPICSATSSRELIAAGVARAVHQPALVRRRPRAPSSLIGGALGREPARAGAVADMRDEVKQVREYSSRVARPAARLLRGVARPAHRRHPLGVGADRDRRRPRRLRRAARAGERAASASSPPRRSCGATRRSSWPPGAASRSIARAIAGAAGLGRDRRRRRRPRSTRSTGEDVLVARARR